MTVFAPPFRVPWAIHVERTCLRCRHLWTIYLCGGVEAPSERFYICSECRSSAGDTTPAKLAELLEDADARRRQLRLVEPPSEADRTLSTTDNEKSRRDGRLLRNLVGASTGEPIEVGGQHLTGGALPHG